MWSTKGVLVEKMHDIFVCKKDVYDIQKIFHYIKNALHKKCSILTNIFLCQKIFLSEQKMVWLKKIYEVFHTHRCLWYSKDVLFHKRCFITQKKISMHKRCSIVKKTFHYPKNVSLCIRYFSAKKYMMSFIHNRCLWYSIDVSFLHVLVAKMMWCFS